MQEDGFHDWPLPYVERLRQRTTPDIDLVVIHCTELPDLATARGYGERVLHDDGSGNSGHWYVDRDGSLHRFVEETRIAHHTRGWNERSIGIELVNTGRYPDWFDTRRQVMTEPYPHTQIDALLALLRRLRGECPDLRWIAGHEDLDTGKVPASDDPSREVFRKRDPGPMFPWDEVLAGCGFARFILRQ
ncbi:MAG: N-acetylmuramoyl-L-alanine amidase [Proteobacteria bacterium]|nr:N-acetylmuramoyl-L-alanine amidase [Pseudomonadota bacterium]